MIRMRGESVCLDDRAYLKYGNHDISDGALIDLQRRKRTIVSFGSQQADVNCELNLRK